MAIPNSPFETDEGRGEWDCLVGDVQEYIVRLERIAKQAERIVVWSQQDAMRTGTQRDNLYEIIREIRNLLSG